MEPFLEQPVARYAPADLARVVARDFAGHEEEVMRILSEYPRRARTEDGGLRVRMACLKLARGSLDRLRHAVKTACGDYRDALAGAEYADYMRATTRAEQQEAIRTDWQRLQDWLHATEPQRIEKTDRSN